MTRIMKDSGIEWIGEIPDSWEVTKLKYFIDCYDGKREPIDSGKRKSGNYPYWGAGSITDYVDDYLFDEELVLLGEDGAPFFDPTRPVAFLVNEKIWVNNHIHVLKPHNTICSNYMVHYLNNVDYKSYINGSILSKLTQSKMNEIVFLLPSLSEQQVISTFLDHQCVHVDKIIEKTKSSIEEYKNLKRAIITQVVTTGMRGDRPMKNIRIGWVEKIPENWTISTIGKVGKTTSGSTPLRSNETDYFVDATIRWVRTLDLNDWIVEDSSEKITELALVESSCSIMPIDTVCVAMYGGGGTIGKCGILKTECATNQAVCSIICNRNRILPMYLLFELLALKGFWMVYAVGTRKDPNISQDIVGKMKIVLPPLEEQKEIAEYLVGKCNAIDDLIAKKERFLAELENYKKSIIYEYVTGKKEA